jgi:hypothetical protein
MSDVQRHEGRPIPTCLNGASKDTDWESYEGYGVVPTNEHDGRLSLSIIRSARYSVRHCHQAILNGSVHLPASTTLKRLEVEAREVRIPGVAEGTSSHQIVMLRGFSLLISFAPPLPPSYVISLLLVAHGGVVQHEIEEVAEQEL